jgi:hypothetical protein
MQNRVPGHDTACIVPPTLIGGCHPDPAGDATVDVTGDVTGATGSVDAADTFDIGTPNPAVVASRLTATFVITVRTATTPLTTSRTRC